MKQCVSISVFGSLYYLLGSACLLKRLLYFPGDIVIHTDVQESLTKIYSQENVLLNNIVFKTFSRNNTLPATSSVHQRYMTDGYDIYHIIDVDSAVSPTQEKAIKSYKGETSFYTCYYHSAHNGIMGGAMGYTAETSDRIISAFKSYSGNYAYGYDEHLLDSILDKNKGILYSNRLAGCAAFAKCVYVPFNDSSFRNTLNTFEANLKYYNNGRYILGSDSVLVDTKLCHN